MILLSREQQVVPARHTSVSKDTMLDDKRGLGGFILHCLRHSDPPSGPWMHLSHLAITVVRRNCWQYIVQYIVHRYPRGKRSLCQDHAQPFNKLLRGEEDYIGSKKPRLEYHGEQHMSFSHSSMIAPTFTAVVLCHKLKSSLLTPGSSEACSIVPNHFVFYLESAKVVRGQRTNTKHAPRGQIWWRRGGASPRRGGTNPRKFAQELTKESVQKAENFQCRFQGLFKIEVAFKLKENSICFFGESSVCAKC